MSEVKYICYLCKSSNLEKLGADINIGAFPYKIGKCEQCNEDGCVLYYYNEKMQKESQ